LPYNGWVYTFVETKLFTRLIDEYLSDEEFAALQLSLAVNPEAGDVIKGSGGVRKLRWAGSGRGKRGGIRVIYYLRLQNGQIWLLTAYAKNVRDDMPAAVLKKIKEELDGTY
jgi:mRNA-degrading endonuclease RelE of RelBE toxin-antitoxin system